MDPGVQTISPNKLQNLDANFFHTPDKDPQPWFDTQPQETLATWNTVIIWVMIVYLFPIGPSIIQYHA